MNWKKTILSFLVLLILMPVFSQSEIDYRHKTVIKFLQKSGIQDLKTLKEIGPSVSKSSTQLINGKYFKIGTENKENFNYMYIGRVYSCRGGGCTISNDSSKDGNSEYFDYFMLFDKKGTVQYVKIFNYQATHGHEVTAKGWLKQFEGFDGKRRLTVGKEIDTISGATISVNAITSDILQKTDLLKEML